MSALTLLVGSKPVPDNVFGGMLYLTELQLLSVRNALSFKSLGPESSFLVCRQNFRIFRSGSYVKVTWSRSRSEEQESMSVCCVWVLNLPCLELESSFYYGGTSYHISRMVS